MMSVPPPAAEGTMKRTGLDGYAAVCAGACAQASTEIRRRIVLIAFMLSLQLELSRLDDFFPLLDLARHVAPHLLRTTSAGRPSPLCELLPDVGERQHAAHLAIHRLYNRAGHSNGPREAEKQALLVTMHATRDRRHVLQRVQS